MILVRRLSLVFALTVMLPSAARAQPAPRLTGVRIDNAFRPVGSNGTGLVVSVRTSDRQVDRTSDDFALIVFDVDGQRSGSAACIAVRFLDGGNPKPPWILLDGPTGTRKKALQAAGRYELVYLIPTTQKRAALAFGKDVVRQPANMVRRLIGSFDVPPVP